MTPSQFPDLRCLAVEMPQSRAPKGWWLHTFAELAFIAGVILFAVFI